MRNDDVVRLRHMLDAAREACGFVNEKVREDLDSGRQLALALVKDIEIIGEAASRVSVETRMAYPDLPWQESIAMRNRLIHGYFAINLDIVWSTVSDELPPLIAELERILRILELERQHAEGYARFPVQPGEFDFPEPLMDLDE